MHLSVLIQGVGHFPHLLRGACHHSGGIVNHEKSRVGDLNSVAGQSNDRSNRGSDTDHPGSNGRLPAAKHIVDGQAVPDVAAGAVDLNYKRALADVL